VGAPTVPLVCLGDYEHDVLKELAFECAQARAWQLRAVGVPENTLGMHGRCRGSCTRLQRRTTRLPRTLRQL